MAPPQDRPSPSGPSFQSDLAEICRARRITELAVFGSSAPTLAAAHLDSDVDVLIRFESGYTPRLSDLLDTRADLVRLFGRAVDVVTAGVIDTAPNDRFSRSVMQSRRVLYAA